MHSNIPKKTLTRLKKEGSGNPEFDDIVRCLELAKESGDDMWKELIFTVLEEMELYQSEEMKNMKEQIIRRLHNGL
ncbi:MAG: hypothetical protein K2G14_04800 [Ruminococcus sp.]|nr:hypothetical protein [Ruminococcus sp.]